MSRYVQKIVFGSGAAVREWWVGWEIDGVSGQVDGLVNAERMSDNELKSIGVNEFQKVSRAMLNQIERRKVLRIRLNEPIDAMILATPVRIIDLSTGGAGIEHDRPLYPGKTIRLDFRHGERAHSMSFEVLRCTLKKQENGRSGVLYYSALRFADENSDARSALRGLVSHFVEMMVHEMRGSKRRSQTESAVDAPSA